VVLPTESGYEAAALATNPEAVRQLAQFVEAEEPPAVALGNAHEAFDWLPHLRGAGVRLPRTFWPGPLTLVSAAGVKSGLARRLPESVRLFLIRDGSLAVRLPDSAWTGVLNRAVAGPLVIAPLSGWPTQVNEITEPERFDLIVDAGPSAFIKPPSVVRAWQRDIEVLREGALARADLLEASRCRIVFVCTGNTCRSPLAQALCGKLLADTLGCEPDQVSERGYCLQSAGLAAHAGNPATLEAATIATEHGADLSGHVSQPLTHELVAQADRIYAMTASHLYLLHSLRLPVGPTPQPLSPAGEDIEDPIGCPEEVYRVCAQQILDVLRQRLPELLEA
jgi:protein-tyrosine-phosphatase/tRNA A37 threonylcarbamoyladenosine synthetase subunit TsaC/SUA5/YrdC